ncbi:MAG: Tol-Pal system beta propeller repeat protein TolB [Proteobacteria bacterium]|nr:Tol-Pal system beta propeller repeat protein TolB [Pseudomonadota bacterium]
MKNYLFNFILFFCITCFSFFASAYTKIDINQGNTNPIPIAINNFDGVNVRSAHIAKRILDVAKQDLISTGLFNLIDDNAFLEHVHVDSIPNFSNWRKINASIIIIGLVDTTDDGKLTLQFKIWDSYNEKSIGGMQYNTHENGWRRVAHKIADKIYENLTGDTGYFDTRITFAAELKKAGILYKKLAIMDYDGANFKMLSGNSDLVLSPSFDMQNQRIIYMSYKGKETPKVYVLNIETGFQRVVGSFHGISFAPRFSPDGNYAILSVGGLMETNIYEVQLETGLMQKITNQKNVVNTSPSYSPDGKKIVFNSNRSGTRQIFVMNRDGSDIVQISQGEGSYTAPSWSPRGDYIAFTKSYMGNFYIGIMKTDGTSERLLTKSWLDESPSWSPNGRIIIFRRQDPDGASRICSVDITGRNERVINTTVDASSPSWSSLLQ